MLNQCLIYVNPWTYVIFFSLSIVCNVKIEQTNIIQRHCLFLPFRWEESRTKMFCSTIFWHFIHTNNNSTALKHVLVHIFYFITLNKLLSTHNLEQPEAKMFLFSFQFFLLSHLFMHWHLINDTWQFWILRFFFLSFLIKVIAVICLTFRNKLDVCVNFLLK